MENSATPLVLIVLDGWGERDGNDSNAIHQADTPNWDKLWASHPHTLIEAAGAAVGLPDGQMGNSEVGHLNIGAGRVVYQDYTRINLAVADGTFNSNPALQQAVQGEGALHVLGLLSPGGVHSHQQQIHALLELAVKAGKKELYLHAFLDGRDTPPKSARAALEKTEALFRRLGVGRVASICGRYFAMDRDNNWDRVVTAYDLLTSGQAPHSAPNALEALKNAYDRGETDEFVLPTTVIPSGGQAARIEEADSVVFMNFRADRARELSQAFLNRDFVGFTRKRWPQLRSFVTLTQYSEALEATVAFPPEPLQQLLGELISAAGLRQLRLAETEKYAHVTFFFNGGREQPFTNESRILVPSPAVATYDLQPQMSATEVTQELVDAIINRRAEVIICNYANADMVGHTGSGEAARLAIEALDRAIGEVVAAVEQTGATLLITADHGNAEMMRDPATGEPHTAHTTNPVPLLMIGNPQQLAEGGKLADIAPTMLALLGIPKPPEMTGHSLLLEQ